MYPQQPYFSPNNMNMPQGNFSPNSIPRKAEIIHVNGENGARAFQMLPNSQALLLDDTAPLVWLAQTDGAGYKTVTPYSISPYQPEPEVDIKELDKRLKKIEEIIDHATKSNTTNAKKHSSDKSQPRGD